MRVGSLVVLGAAGFGVVAGASPAWAGGQAPGGNNGTIKIESGPPDDDKANEPHVSCEVFVEFWGYDRGTQTAELEFAAQAPTTGGVVLRDTATWTTARREGGRHLDHTHGPIQIAAAMADAGIAPAKQGYHVKLTVHVTGSQGADVKHKVFWVEPCAGTGGTGATTTTAPPAPTTTAAPGGTTTPTTGAATTIPGETTTTTAGALGGTTTGGTAGGTSVDGAVLGVSVERAAADQQGVLGASIERAGVSAQARGSESARSGALPRTGSYALRLLALGGTALATGAGMTRWARRRQAAAPGA